MSDGRSSGQLRADDAALLSLVGQVAAGDKVAFADLHATLARPLIEQLRRAALDQQHADAIVAATFIEVWWLARYFTAPDTDVAAWVAGIAARRTAEWIRHSDPTLPAPYSWIAAGAESYYRRVDLALAELLVTSPRAG